MGKPGRTTRQLLIAMLMFVSIFATVIWAAANDPALVAAAKDGDLSTVRTLLARRANPNDVARDGSTALLWAVHNSDIGMVRSLVAAGAYLHATNRYGITPLLEASRSGDTPMIAELLKAGADPRKSNHPEGETPLMAACLLYTS